MCVFDSIMTSILNMFKKKSDEEYLAELLDQIEKDPRQLAPPTTGAAAASQMIGTSSVPLGVSIGQMMSQMAGLSKEEERELHDLKKEHEYKLKVAKLAVFKNLHPALRQSVIDNFEWKQCINNMNSMSILRDARLQELETKKRFADMYGGNHHKAYMKDEMMFQFSDRLPEGITVEDLKQAHLEATTEEQLVGNAPNE